MVSGAPGSHPNPIAAALGAAQRAVEGLSGALAARLPSLSGATHNRGGEAGGSAPGGVSTWPGAEQQQGPHAPRRRQPHAGRVAWRTEATATGQVDQVAPPHASPSSVAAADPKAELGRSTWTLIHTLAAQFPDRPSRGQRRDVAKLVRKKGGEGGEWFLFFLTRSGLSMPRLLFFPASLPSFSSSPLSLLQVDVLTRIYPCGECATHFAALVRARPPDTTSGPALRAWACEAHNAVNASLGKPAFNCRLVGARWAPLDCGEGGEDGSGGACALK